MLSLPVKGPRPISIGVPSGVVKLTLWSGTEDEESFAISFPKRGRPYVKAYGMKYELTEEEAGIVNTMRGVVLK